jgi:hypothetical protein
MNEAKVLAKELAHATYDMNESKGGTELEVYKEAYEIVTMKIVNSPYSAETVLRYMEEYMKLKLGEHATWINE